MMNTFTKEPLHIDDIVAYLKNERTGSSTVRKCKFLGQITGFTKTKVEIHRLSPPDTFVTPDECKDFGIDTVYPDDVVHVIISKYEEDHTIYFPCVIGDDIFHNKTELVEFVKEYQEELRGIANAASASYKPIKIVYEGDIKKDLGDALRQMEAIPDVIGDVAKELIL